MAIYVQVLLLPFSLESTSQWLYMYNTYSYLFLWKVRHDPWPTLPFTSFKYFTNLQRGNLWSVFTGRYTGEYPSASKHKNACLVILWCVASMIQMSVRFLVNNWCPTYSHLCEIRDNLHTIIHYSCYTSGAEPRRHMVAVMCVCVCVCVCVLFCRFLDER